MRRNMSGNLGQYKYLLPGSVYTSAHTLARSLHDVARANNNRFAVVVCSRLTFHASGMRFFLEIFELKKFSFKE